MPTGCSLLCYIAELETAKVIQYQILYAGWYKEKLKGKGDELVRDRAIGILQIQPDNTEVGLLPLTSAAWLLESGPTDI